MYQSDNVMDKYYECDSHVGRSGETDSILVNGVRPGDATSLSILYNIRTLILRFLSCNSSIILLTLAVCF